MLRKRVLMFITLSLLVVSLAGPVSAQGDPVLERLNQINADLISRGLNIQIAAVHYFGFGQGRPADRILQQSHRWVPYDPNRGGRANLTYVVDLGLGATTSGLASADTEAAIDAAMDTWNTENCLRNVDIVKLQDDGGDHTIYDAFFGYGGFGDYTYADIVNAGWYPWQFFQDTTGNGDHVLAFSVTFIWTDNTGVPTDFNNDGYADTALNEVYYNDAFGGAQRPDNLWAIFAGPPNIDVQTVAYHENGHSIGLGHFGPPPVAIMNPVYDGIRHEAYPTDHAGLCTQFARWPN
jgi:hypothetical protein